MAGQITKLNLRKFVVFASMVLVTPWMANSRAQKVDVKFSSIPELNEMEKKVDSRSKPATVTTEEESTLVSKGYVQIGNITSTSTETGAEIAKELDDSILNRAGAVGGDMVRFEKRGVATQDTETIEPQLKNKTRCASWVTDTTYTTETEPQYCSLNSYNVRECTGGGTEQVAHHTQRCTLWETDTDLVGKETTLVTSRLTSEGTVWRYDPDLLAAITLERRNRPSDSMEDSFFEALKAEDDAATRGRLRKDKWYLAHASEIDAKIEAMLKDSPLLANIPNWRTSWTPLGFAADSGNKELIDVLLANGARINGKDSSGETALFKLSGYGEDQSGLAEYLISKGADVNAEDNDGHTPLYKRLNQYKPSKGDKHIASVLRKHGGHE